MAGLISGPRPPAASQIVFTPQTISATSPAPTSTSTSTSSGAASTTSTATTSQNLAQSTEESRIASLLASQRGRGGTIRTGFLGITDDDNATPQRKTLLGE